MKLKRWVRDQATLVGTEGEEQRVAEWRRRAWATAELLRRYEAGEVLVIDFGGTLEVVETADGYVTPPPAEVPPEWGGAAGPMEQRRIEELEKAMAERPSHWVGRALMEAFRDAYFELRVELLGAMPLGPAGPQAGPDPYLRGEARKRLSDLLQMEASLKRGMEPGERWAVMTSDLQLQLQKDSDQMRALWRRLAEVCPRRPDRLNEQEAALHRINDLERSMAHMRELERQVGDDRDGTSLRDARLERDLVRTELTQTKQWHARWMAEHRGFDTTAPSAAEQEAVATAQRIDTALVLERLCEALAIIDTVEGRAQRRHEEMLGIQAGNEAAADGRHRMVRQWLGEEALQGANLVAAVSRGIRADLQRHAEAVAEALHRPTVEGQVLSAEVGRISKALQPDSVRNGGRRVCEVPGCEAEAGGDGWEERPHYLCEPHRHFRPVRVADLKLAPGGRPVCQIGHHCRLRVVGRVGVLAGGDVAAWCCAKHATGYAVEVRGGSDA